MKPTPAYLVTGVSPTATDTTTLAMQWDLPSPVVLTHDIAANGTTLVRTISDITGTLEREEIDLEHACTACAVREDVLPTLARLHDLGRWESIICRLPLGAEATQVCRVAAWDPEQVPGVRIAGVINALRGCEASESLTGAELLCEQPIHTFLGDDRGLAEVATRLLEYSDLVAVEGDLTDRCGELVRALARPSAGIVTDWTSNAAQFLGVGLHDHDAIEEWVDEVPCDPHSHHHTHGLHVWRLRLSSDRPLHPERMRDELEALAAGPHRSRGCFWVPTRPRSLGVWDGAGGQLSIGAMGRWDHRRRRRTDIVVTGLHMHGDDRAEIAEAFERALCTPVELDGLGRSWNVESDGLEPWLGEIEEVA